MFGLIIETRIFLLYFVVRIITQRLFRTQNIELFCQKELKMFLYLCQGPLSKCIVKIHMIGIYNKNNSVNLALKMI